MQETIWSMLVSLTAITHITAPQIAIGPWDSRKGYNMQKILSVSREAQADPDFLFVGTVSLAYNMEGDVMVRSKPKKEKRKETTEEFVKRVNQQGGKRNGLKRRVGHHH